MSRLPERLLELKMVDCGANYELEAGKKTVIREKFSDPSSQVPHLRRYSMYTDMVSAKLFEATYKTEELYEVECLADLIFPPPYRGHKEVPIWFDHDKFEEFTENSYLAISTGLTSEYQAWCPFRFEDLVYHSQKILDALYKCSQSRYSYAAKRRLIKALRQEFRGPFSLMTKTETPERMGKWDRVTQQFERGSLAIAEWLMWDYTDSPLFWGDRMSKLPTVDTEFARKRAGRPLYVTGLTEAKTSVSTGKKEGGIKFV